MARTKQAGSRISSLPWEAILGALMVLGSRWTALSSKERARLTELVRSSRGRLDRLSSRERNELARIVRQLDVMGAGRELVALRRRAGRRRP